METLEKEISDNSYELNHHFTNMGELNELLVDKINESEFTIDDFVFYITDDKKVLNIKHFIFDKSLEIEQWIEEIRHINYNF